MAQVSPEVATHQTLRGHRPARGGFTDAVYSKASLVAGVDYTLGLTLKGTTVSVTLNAQLILSRGYKTRS